MCVYADFQSQHGPQVSKTEWQLAPSHRDGHEHSAELLLARSHPARCHHQSRNLVISSLLLAGSEWNDLHELGECVCGVESSEELTSSRVAAQECPGSRYRWLCNSCEGRLTWSSTICVYKRYVHRSQV